MRHIPCEFSDVYYMIDGKPYRWIYLYLVIVDSPDSTCPLSITPFTSRSVAYDNLCLANECGFLAQLDCFKDICHESHYPELWKKICDYVSSSDND